MAHEITSEMVNAFLNGHDPMEHIITIECDYKDDKVSIIYVNAKGEKRIKLDDFKPFVWVKHSAAIRMFEGNKSVLRSKLRQYGIAIKTLTTNVDGKTHERLENGYKYMFYATRRMSTQRFNMFFQESGVPLRERQKKGETKPSSNREYMSVAPIEQYMIATGRRLFKGYENYDDLTRFVFDLETQGLNPHYHRIEQIGMRTNKGFEKIISVDGQTKEELDRNELEAIEGFLVCLAEQKPDIIVGHNSENFDWDFMMVRCQELGASFEEMSLKYFRYPIYKRKTQQTLKLGGEIEYYFPTIMWGHIILDSLHAARRAQAADSNMKSSNLKYVTKYLKIQKENRVYVPGNIISETWNNTTEPYAFCEQNGDWYKITDTHSIQPNYQTVNGRYIVERYLMDDLWETDKCESRLNENNFLIGKLLPTTFARACTMGTAGIWKLIMLAWCYENDLAVPAAVPSRRFTGGLSRLLKTGYVDRIVKLDYNSLYPSIILTWNIQTPIDVTNVMLKMLDYVLTEREKYKGLKKAAGKKAKELEKEAERTHDKAMEEEAKYYEGEEMRNDKKQLPLKTLGNSFFGSYGSPQVFPFGDPDQAEMTTCIGRQSLRLMISHFTKLEYVPIVGDSFTGDTPLFIKYDDTGFIDIKPIEKLMGHVQVDGIGREYDYEDKPYKVLCRSGWMKPNYLYRHKTDKPLYTVEENDMSVTVTEDHSLFNKNQEKIKPSQITSETELEYYGNLPVGDKESQWINERRAQWLADAVVYNNEDTIPRPILNTSKVECIKIFLNGVSSVDPLTKSKTYQAGINYLKRKFEILNGTV